MSIDVITKAKLVQLAQPPSPMPLMGLLLAGVLALGGCVTQTVRIVDMTPPNQIDRYQTEGELLDVGIAVFDPNVPEDFDTRVENMISREIRRAEAQYVPYFAKNLLQSTGNWGAVRVVPRATHAVDVTVSGKILDSNGEEMAIEIEVYDATGQQWFAKEYRALASRYAYEDTIPPDIDAFQTIYKQLSDDMLAYRESLSDEKVREIRTVAEMQFARDFSSEAFATHVTETAPGKFTITRLPAEDDPMLERVRKIREREYLFIDTLDEYYSSFHRKMHPAYNSWRKASYTDSIAYEELRVQARARIIGGAIGIVGSVGAIYQSDNAYVDASGIGGVIGGSSLIVSGITKRHEAEQHADRLREVGSAAEAELVPTTIELENQTIRLQGSVDQQYGELREILRRLYFEDLGLEPPEPAIDQL
jgi:hypothetical protein